MMPTFAEIGREYAERVVKSIRKDGFTKTASLSTARLYGTNVVAVLREISGELDSKWTIDDKPLTEQQKQQIAVEAGRQLGLDQPEEFHWAVKAASNDAYMELVEHISNIIKKKG
jgi:hypothetical protein